MSAFNQKLQPTKLGKDKRKNPKSRILCETQTLFTVEWVLK